eukprot:g96.t1
MRSLLLSRKCMATFFILLVLSVDRGVMAFKTRAVENNFKDINSSAGNEKFKSDSTSAFVDGRRRADFHISFASLRALSGELHTFAAALLSVTFDRNYELMKTSIEDQGNQSLQGLTRLICGTSLYESFSASEAKRRNIVHFRKKNTKEPPFPLHLVALEENIPPIASLFGYAPQSSFPLRTYNALLLLNYTVTNTRGENHIVDINLSEKSLEKCKLRFLPPTEQVKRPFSILQDSQKNRLEGDYFFSRENNAPLNVNITIASYETIVDALHNINVDAPAYLERMACEEEKQRLDSIYNKAKHTLTGNIAADLALKDLPSKLEKKIFDTSTTNLLEHSTNVKRITRPKLDLNRIADPGFNWPQMKAHHSSLDVSDIPSFLREPVLGQLSSGEVYVKGGMKSIDRSKPFINIKKEDVIARQSSQNETESAMNGNSVESRAHIRYRKAHNYEGDARFKSDPFHSDHTVRNTEDGRLPPVISVSTDGRRDFFDLDLTEPPNNKTDLSAYRNTPWDKTLLTSPYRGVPLAKGKRVFNCIFGSRRISVKADIMHELFPGDRVICGHDVTDSIVQSTHFKDPKDMYFMLTKKYPNPDQIETMMYKIKSRVNGQDGLQGGKNVDSNGCVSARCDPQCSDGCSESGNPFLECGGCDCIGSDPRVPENCCPGAEGFPAVGCEMQCKTKSCPEIESPIEQCGGCPYPDCPVKGKPCCNRKKDFFKVSKSVFFMPSSATCVPACVDPKNVALGGCNAINNFSLVCSECPCGGDSACSPDSSTWPEGAVAGMPFEKPKCDAICSDVLVGGCASIPDSTVACGACESKEGTCSPFAPDWPKGALPGIPLDFTTPPDPEGLACVTETTLIFGDKQYDPTKDADGAYNSVTKSILSEERGITGAIPGSVVYFQNTPKDKKNPIGPSLAASFKNAVPKVEATNECPDPRHVEPKLEEMVNAMVLPEGFSTPTFTFKTPRLPTFKLPELKLPSLPNFDLPKLPNISLPQIELPPLPEINLPTYKPLEVNIPSIPVPGVPLPNPIPPPPEPYPDPLMMLMKILMIIFNVIKPIIMGILQKIMEIVIAILLDVLLQILQLIFVPKMPKIPPNFAPKLPTLPGTPQPVAMLPDFNYPKTPELGNLNLNTLPNMKTNMPGVPGGAYGGSAGFNATTPGLNITESGSFSAGAKGSGGGSHGAKTDGKKRDSDSMSDEDSTEASKENQQQEMKAEENGKNESKDTIIEGGTEKDQNNSLRISQSKSSTTSSATKDDEQKIAPTKIGTSACAGCASVTAKTNLIKTKNDMTSKIAPGDAIRIGSDDKLYGVTKVTNSTIEILPDGPTETLTNTDIRVIVGGFSPPPGTGVGLTAGDEFARLSGKESTIIMRGKDGLAGVRSNSTFIDNANTKNDISKQVESSLLEIMEEIVMVKEKTTTQDRTEVSKNSELNAIEKLEHSTYRKMRLAKREAEDLRTELLRHGSEEMWQDRIAKLQVAQRKYRETSLQNLHAHVRNQNAKVKSGRHQYAGHQYNAGYGSMEFGEFDKNRFASLRSQSNKKALEDLATEGGYHDLPPGDNGKPSEYGPKGNIPYTSDQKTNFMCAGLVCAIYYAVRAIAPIIALGVSSNVSPVLNDQLGDMITEMLPETMRDYLANALDRKITGPLVSNLVPVLVDQIATSVVRETPNRVVRKLTKGGLLHTLPLALVQSVVPALTHTLSHSPLQDYYCYYCFKYKLYCSYCNYSPSQLYYTQIYASYFGQYYTSFYSQSYSYLLKKKAKRKSDTSWIFEKSVLP